MKKLLKRIVLLIGTVCLCFLGVSYFGPLKEAQAALSYSVSTYAQLVSACSQKGDVTVTITADITLAGTVTIPKGSNVNISGNLSNNGRVIKPSDASNCFTVESGGKLTVSNLTVDRASHPHGNVFLVKAGGALIVNSGVYKTGNGSAGQGATVLNAEGMVTINNGTFSGAKAEFYAVCLYGPYNYVINNGTFTQSTSGVGVNLAGKTDTNTVQTLTINNGNFTGNINNGITVGDPTTSQAGKTTVTINGGNFYNNGLNGVSVCYTNQTCNIKRADVYGNTTGLLAAGGTINFISTASDAGYLKVHDNGVSGVAKGDTNVHNICVQTNGAFFGGYANVYNTGTCLDKVNGVRVSAGKVTIKEGMNIKDCSNGVISYSSSGNVTVDGGSISGCTTGINMDASGTCTIKNVNVTGNEVGIDADYGSTVEMIKGTITNNTTGIWCESSSKTTLAGSSAGAIVIAGNSSEGIKVSHSATLTTSNTNIFGGNGYNSQKVGVYMGSSKTATIGGNIYANSSAGVEVINGSLTSTANVYSHTNRGIIANTTGTVTVSGTINNNYVGVETLSGTLNSTATYHTNSYGLYVPAGTANVKGGSAKSNTYGVYVGGGTCNISSGSIYSNTEAGVHVGAGTCNLTGGSVYSNKNGLACAGGTTTSSVNLYNNTNSGVYVKGGTFTMSGGEITSNKNYGMYLVGTPKVTVSGGNISSNAGAYGEVYDDITDFTLTGTYGGRSSVNGYVYLAKNDNYVKTVSSSTLIKVRPSTYYSGRVVINTSSTSYAATQERSTLYPNSNWILKKSGVNVVLARIPSIYYNNTEVTGTLTLGWYNADTISGMGKFTAKDPDNDLSSFIMKYEGQTVATGTKDSAGVMHLDYDFKIEGIREYTLTATDSLGNSVTRTVIVMVDLTPPSIIDVPGSDGEPDDGSDPDDGDGGEPDDGDDDGPSGEGATYTWTVVIVEPDATIEQQGEDMLSGVANISVSKFSEQNVYIKKIYDAPYKVKVSLADYPDERGVVIKVVDKAGNAAYKCVLDKSRLEIKIEPFYPTK